MADKRKKTNPIRADNRMVQSGWKEEKGTMDPAELMHGHEVFEMKEEQSLGDAMKTHAGFMGDVHEKSRRSLRRSDRTSLEPGLHVGTKRGEPAGGIQMSGKAAAGTAYTAQKAGQLLFKSQKASPPGDDPDGDISEDILQETGEQTAFAASVFRSDKEKSQQAIDAWRSYSIKEVRATSLRTDSGGGPKQTLRGAVQKPVFGDQARVSRRTMKEGMASGFRRWKQDSPSILSGRRNRQIQYQRRMQKLRYQQAYRAARQGRISVLPWAGIPVFGQSAAWNASGGARKVFRHVVTKNRTIWIVLLSLLILAAVFATSLSSCSAVMQEVSTVIVATTYPSTDDDIYAVEEAYEDLESRLNEQINAMEAAHPGHDSYYYQIDEIAHNPFHLISYLTVLYGGFAYEDVKDFLPNLIQLQYTLSVNESNDNVITTKQVGVGESLGTVVTSGYCSCALCCGKYAGGPTASGAMPKAEHTLAVDTTNPVVPLGTRIIMNGIEYTVEDTGAFGKYGVDFDVYYASHSEAQAHGHKTFEAYLADDNGEKTIEVKTSGIDDNLKVMLTNKGLDAVAKDTLSKEQYQYFELLNSTYGNRKGLFDVTKITISAGNLHDAAGQVPTEALSDERFARMISEANKYLGMRYVWGGSSPSTGFDCSGFVSWVINHSGNGWNVGRLTAEGLRQICTPVPLADAKPGDLIFFQGTYNTSGASHVGIYVGNSRMIHCGNPISYTNITSNYWVSHYMQCGRLP